jgi:RNA polymerase sigma-70 factor (ECF subfamily)
LDEKSSPERPDLNDAELIRSARRGDQAAWEALVRAHQEAAFRLAYLFTGDSDSASDVAQEAFVRAFQALDRFDMDRSFKPWLMSIVANQARNQLRSAGRHLSALRRLFQETPLRDKDAESSMIASWKANTLWKAVRKLDLDDQQVIYYRYFLDLPVSETASALGVAEGTVKSRLHRALDRLKSVIARHYPELGEGWEA